MQASILNLKYDMKKKSSKFLLSTAKAPKETEAPPPPPDNKVCETFRDALIPLIEWSEKHLAECSYESKKGPIKNFFLKFQKRSFKRCSFR